MSSLSHIYGVRLTRREKEVHSLVAEGLSSRQIADKLDISEFTVSNHRKSILKKKGIKSLKGCQGICA